MILGIFAKTFVRASLGETLDAVVAHGLKEVQFNLACCGLPTLPEAVSMAQVREICGNFEARGLTMAALSATGNLIHPNPNERTAVVRRVASLAGIAAELGTGVLTLCTGTRDAENMWRAHPANDAESAREDLLRSLEVLLEAAARFGVVLGVEPELANVIDTAARARWLLDQFRSPHLKIVIDPANLFPAGTLPRMTQILNEAFDLLGNDLVLAHAKDLGGDGAAGHEAAGTGVLDYDLYVERLGRARFAGPLILHGLREDQVPASLRFLRTKTRSP